jgi:hypothetical protein
VADEPRAETHAVPKDQLPKHGPEAAKPLPNRADRRRWAREAARQLNRTRKRTVVAYQKED